MQTKLKPKEDYELFKQEIILCEALAQPGMQRYDKENMFDAERERLTRRGLWFIIRGFYAPAVAKELLKLWAE